MSSNQWFSGHSQVFWTCKALLEGRTINHRMEIREVRGWRLGAIIHRLRRLCPDTFYVVFYVALILVWPHPDHMTRFVYALMPLALLYTFAGVCVALDRYPAVPSRPVRLAAVLLMLALVYPNVFVLIDRYNTPIASHIPEDFRHTHSWLLQDNLAEKQSGAEIKHNVISLLKRAPRHLEPNECIYTDHIPLVMLYGHRPAERLPPKLSPRWLRKCEYLFIMNLSANHYPKYPLDVLDHDRLELVDIEHDKAGNQQAYLFRLVR